MHVSDKLKLENNDMTCSRSEANTSFLPLETDPNISAGVCLSSSNMHF